MAITKNDILLVFAFVYPNTKWHWHSDDYDDFVWEDAGEKPSIEDLETALPLAQRTRALMNLRGERNQRLAEADWTQVLDSPVDKGAWAEYRQALRDLPENTTDPENPVWPTPPA